MKNIIRFNKNEIIITIQETGKIIKRLEASVKEARIWIKENGWVPLDIEETAAGNIVIWVA